MKITVKRKGFFKDRTMGEIYVDGEFFGYTLEDTVREKKIYGQTAIPAGTYDVIVTMSARFKKELPLLLNVDGFEGVRIHGGNTESDTLGCILVAKSSNEVSRIWDCSERVATLTKKIKAAKKAQLEIVEER